MSKQITDEEAIICRLADVLKIDIPAKEKTTKSGFQKVVEKMKENGWTNAHLNKYRIDLVSFEKLCRKYGCYRFIFNGRKKFLGALQKFQAFQESQKLASVG